MFNTVEDVEEYRCTGCGACKNICPVLAISMEENTEGFLVPVIDNDKCIKCGKCKKVCPTLRLDYTNNAEPDVYAAEANDALRMKSSSGGIFPVLAEYVQSENGIVIGAAYSDDFRSVNHIAILPDQDISPLLGSKYVQSNTGNIYKETKEYLDSGRMVLFSGTPCQIAGLKSFLSKDYENLLTVDILCHGVPSAKVFRKYLDSVVTNGRQEVGIESFSFRDKAHHGWGHSVYAVMKDGYYYSKPKTGTMWYNAFLGNLDCRLSCGNCQFSTLPRQGDISLGDFWNQEGVSAEFRDGKGISIVCINNNKGEKVFNIIKSQLIRYEKSDIDTAKKMNARLVQSTGANKNRYRFFELLDKYDFFDKIVDYSCNRKFDVGLVGWWYGKNYGSAITDYALWKVITDLNYSVLMLDWPEKDYTDKPKEDTAARRFADKHYEISMRRTYNQLHNLNNYIDTFVVASDQLWNYWSTKDNGGYFFLDFVEDSKKKIAYATSFGTNTYWAPREQLTENVFHMNRFDAISVREDSGVDVCRETFGVDSQCNADPVFLVEKEHWDSIASESKINTDGRYLLAYILTPTKEKRDTILRIAEKENLSVKLILDGQDEQGDGKRIMDMDYAIVEDLEIEDWLKLIRDSQLVLNDSFHGTCFSIIYRKKFATFANIERGIDRFQTLLGRTGLEGRMVYRPEEAERMYNEEIDYTSVFNRVESWIESSKKWLADNLAKNKPQKASAYDLLMRKFRN